MMINIKDIEQDVFSNNNEDFDYYNQPHEFIEDNELSVGDTFYAGMKKELKNSDFFDVDELIEQMQECADSECGEFAEGYLVDLDRGNKELIQNEISKVLDMYLPSVKFYDVVDTVKYRIVAIDDDENVFVELVEGAE